MADTSNTETKQSPRNSVVAFLKAWILRDQPDDVICTLNERELTVTDLTLLCETHDDLVAALEMARELVGSMPSENDEAMLCLHSIDASLAKAGA